MGSKTIDAPRGGCNTKIYWYKDWGWVVGANECYSGTWMFSG